jgi:hypothetical protein
MVLFNTAKSRKPPLEPKESDMDMIKITQLTVTAVLAGTVALCLWPATARAAEDDSGEGMACYNDGTGCRPCKSDRECAEGLGARPVVFKGWQRAWQCSDIRVTETVTQRGIVNYDLAGTIWGGSQFALDIQRGTMWFNGRPCAFLGGTP